MNNKNEESTCLASLAVFRELYNTKKDIYGVIGSFLNEIIKSKGLQQLNIQQLSNLLNDTYEFSIPEAVVRTACGRLNYLKKKDGVYIVDNAVETPKEEISVLQKETKSNNEVIIKSLFDFIQTEKGIELGNIEKRAIEHAFCSFLLDKANGEEYTKYISAFLVNKETDIEFRKRLNRIREGVVLYSGLKYNNNLNDLGSWKTQLTIYLDTEIMFNLAGFNGEVYKSLFDDFNNYVKEINRKSGSSLIKLRYLKEVKCEIDGFFNKAKYIIEGKDNVSPNGTAMNSIVEGAKEYSDIEDKKSDFYLLLDRNNIIEDNTIDYFNESNYTYNIIDQDTINLLSDKMEFDVTQVLGTLNLINIKRNKSHSENFENIGSILLTANSKTLKVSWDELVKSDGSVPLATTLSFLINKFWFKLNKGFGKGAFPKSFDVITKAQMLLSTEVNESIGLKYIELQNQYKAGKLTDDQVKARIINLRSNVRKPEEVVKDDVSSILHVITQDNLEKFNEEQEYFKNQALKKESENIRLKNEALEKESENINLKKIVKLNAIEFKNKELGIRSNTLLAKDALFKEKCENKKSLLLQKGV